MSRTRRIGVVVAVATAAVGVAAGTSAAPAAASTLDGPQPVSSWLRAVKAHSDSWVNIYWRTSSPVCDVKVKVAGRGVDVSYPGHRRFASFSRGDMLRPSRPDYTAVSVDADFARSGVALLKTTVAYDDCTRHAPTRYRSFTLALPVQRNHDWPGHGLPGHPGQPSHPGQPGPGQPGNGGNGPGNPSPTNSPSPHPSVTSSPSASPSVTSSPTTSVPTSTPTSMPTRPSTTTAPGPTTTPSATTSSSPTPPTRPGGGEGHGPVHP